MKKKALLIVEDNPLLVGMYKTAFEKKGVKVSVAHDGEAGIKLVKEEKPDMVVLDLLMPGVDGYEVLKTLKSDPETKKIKVVVLTVVVTEESRKRVNELGAVDYIIKTELKLSEIVERVMSRF